MNSQPVNLAQNRLSPAWHEQFLSTLLPRVKTHARFRFRDLPEVEREEAEAESIAVALIFFVRLVEHNDAFGHKGIHSSILRCTHGHRAKG